MKGDAPSVLRCPVELRCRECRTVFDGETAAEDADVHLDLHPGHDVGACAAVVGSADLALTPEYSGRQALRKHFYNTHPGLSPRRVSLYLDAAQAAQEKSATPPGPPLEFGTDRAGSPSPDAARPLPEAHASTRADPSSDARPHKPSGTVVASATTT